MSTVEYNTGEPEVMESAEFEYFKSVMSMCGRFPRSHVRRMFEHCDILELEANEVMFEVGDPDDFIYLIIHGSIQVLNIDDKTGAVKKLRVAQRGDRVLSLFSVVDVLTVSYQA